MAYVPKILAFAGSTRQGSLNKKLVKTAADAARAAGAQVTLLDLRDLSMPLYDGDLETAQGLPENAKTFKAMLLAHDGLLISTPEYNGGVSGVLKNSIDWASRAVPNEPAKDCFSGKAAVLLSASPGILGGLRSLTSLQNILVHMKVLVVPEPIAVGRAHEAFDSDGNLKDAKLQTAVQNLSRDLVQILAKLKDQPS